MLADVWRSLLSFAAKSIPELKFRQVNDSLIKLSIDLSMVALVPHAFPIAS